MATIYTFNPKLRRRLRLVAEERPDEVVCKGESLDGGITYVLPHDWITVRAPRKYTTAQREKMAQRAREVFGK